MGSGSQPGDEPTLKTDGHTAKMFEDEARPEVVHGCMGLFRGGRCVHGTVSHVQCALAVALKSTLNIDVGP